ncbi:hypothetical protein RRG08_026363 [Elysia crispata]|uniref:Uncharacterized protein n=1 Tax=Elysia crispata TaxID=231223 RepID=A0AAE0XN29_9GAST|nr:hypothetical protein RRG08_026363 [Elysia crispata]
MEYLYAENLALMKLRWEVNASKATSRLSHVITSSVLHVGLGSTTTRLDSTTSPFKGGHKWVLNTSQLSWLCNVQTPEEKARRRVPGFLFLN